MNIMLIENFKWIKNRTSVDLKCKEKNRNDKNFIEDFSFQAE